MIVMPEGEAVRSITHVDVDPKKALRYWKEASMLGHAQASYNIGIMFANGMGIDQDLWQAGKWFGRAVKLDTTGKLVVPQEVEVVEWDARKEDKDKKKSVGDGSTSQEQQPKQRQRKDKRGGRKKRSKRSRGAQQEDDGVLGAIIALGSVAAVAGIVYWVYTRSLKKMD